MSPTPTPTPTPHHIDSTAHPIAFALAAAEATIEWARVAKREAAKYKGPNGHWPDSALMFRLGALEARALELRAELLRGRAVPRK